MSASPQICVLVRSREIANPGDIGSISLCGDWDSVAPLAGLLSSESAVSRVELCTDAACQEGS